MRGSIIACAAAVASLLAPTAARPDNEIVFSDDEPAFPHVWLDLTPAQRKAVAAFQAAGSPWPWPEIRLSARQRAVLKEQAQADVPWLFAVDRATATSGCSCGAYNLGVVVGRRLAVLMRDLGDYLAPGDVPGLERDLVDRRLAGAPPPGAARTWVPKAAPRLRPARHPPGRGPVSRRVVRAPPRAAPRVAGAAGTSRRAAPNATRLRGGQRPRPGDAGAHRRGAARDPGDRVAAPGGPAPGR